MIKATYTASMSREWFLDFLLNGLAKENPNRLINVVGTDLAVKSVDSKVVYGMLEGDSMSEYFRVMGESEWMEWVDSFINVVKIVS
jgi:hypothetical protein